MRRAHCARGRPRAAPPAEARRGCGARLPTSAEAPERAATRRAISAAWLYPRSRWRSRDKGNATSRSGSGRLRCARSASERAGRPLGEREAALVLERVHQPVDGKGIGESGDRRVERRRMGEAAAADRAARGRQRAHRTRRVRAAAGRARTPRTPARCADGAAQSSQRCGSARRAASIAVAAAAKRCQMRRPENLTTRCPSSTLGTHSNQHGIAARCSPSR